MRIKYVLLGALLIALQLGFAHAGAANPAVLNQTLNQTSQYIQTVNESGYLIFYPNLTQAYYYFYQAKNESNTTQALYLLSLAKQSAQQQEAKLNSDETSGAVASGVFVVLCSLALYLAMSPKKSISKKQKR